MLSLRFAVLLLVLSSTSVLAQPARFVVDPPPGQCIDRKNIEFALEILDPGSTEIVHAVIDTDNILIGVANTETTQTAPNTLLVSTSVVPPAGEKVYLHVAQLNTQTGDTIWYTDTYFSSGEKNGRFLRDGSEAEGYGAPIEVNKIDWKRDGDFEVYGGYWFYDGALDYDELFESSERAIEGYFSGLEFEQIQVSSSLLDANQFRFVGVPTNLFPPFSMVLVDGLDRDTVAFESTYRIQGSEFFYSPVFRHMEMTGLTLDSNDNFVKIKAVGDSLVGQPLQASGRTLITAVDQSANGGFEFLSIEEGVVRFVDFNGTQFKDGPTLVVGPAVAQVYQADFDNNGKVDYILLYADGSNAYIRVDANGVFSTSELDFQHAGQFYVLDLDGDRFVDISTIARTNKFGPTGIQGYGNESGHFEHYMYPAIGSQLAWIDYNNNGVLTGANEEKSHSWDDPVAHARFSFADRYVDSVRLFTSGLYHFSGYTPMSYPGAHSGLLTLSEHQNAVRGNSTARVSKTQWNYYFDKYFEPAEPESSLPHTSYLFGYSTEIAPKSNCIVFDKAYPTEMRALTNMDRIETMYQLDSYELLHRDSKGVLYLYYIYNNSLYAVNYNLVLQRIPTQHLLIENNVTDLLAIDDFNEDGANDYVLNREQGTTEIVVSDGTSMKMTGAESLRKMVKTDANADGYIDIIGLGADFVFLLKGSESGFLTADTLFRNVDDVFIGDFDDNNLLDILVQRHERSKCQVRYNFLEKDSIVTLQDLWGKKLRIQDITSDRSPELLVYDVENQTLEATSLNARSDNPVFGKDVYQRAYSGEQFVGNYRVYEWYGELLMIDSHDGITTMYEVDDFKTQGRSHTYGDFRVLDVIDANGDDFLEFIGIDKHGSLVILDGSSQTSPIEEVENRGNDAYQISFEDAYHKRAFLDSGSVSFSSSVRGGLGSGAKESSGYSRAEVHLDGDRLPGERLVLNVSYHRNEEEISRTFVIDNSQAVSSSNTLHLVSSVEALGQEFDNSTLLGYSGGTTLSLDQNNALVMNEGHYDRYSVNAESPETITDQIVLDAQLGTKNRTIGAVYLDANRNVVGTSFDESLLIVDQFLMVIDGNFNESCVFTKRGKNIMYSTPDTTVSVSSSGLLVDVVWLQNRTEQGVLIADTSENSISMLQPVYTSDGVELQVIDFVAPSANHIEWVDVVESEGGVFRELVWMQDGMLRSLSKNGIPLESCPVDSIVSLACIDANLDGQIELVVVDKSGDLFHLFYDSRDSEWITLRSIRGQGYTSVYAQRLDLSPHQDVLAYRADGPVDWYSNSLPNVSSSIRGDVSSRYVSYDNAEITLEKTYELCNVQPDEVSVFTEYMGTIDHQCDFLETENTVSIQLPKLVPGDRVYVELLQSSCEWYDKSLYRNVMFKVQGEPTSNTELFPLFSSDMLWPSYGFVTPVGSATAVGWLRDGDETNAIHYSVGDGIWIGETLRTESNVQPQTDHMVGSFGARVPAFVTGVDSGFLMIAGPDTTFYDRYTYGAHAFPFFHNYVVRSPNSIPLVVTRDEQTRLLAIEQKSWLGFEFENRPSFLDIDSDGVVEAVGTGSVVEFNLKSNQIDQPVHTTYFSNYVIPLHLDGNRVVDIVSYNRTQSQLTLSMRGPSGSSTQVVDGVQNFNRIASYDINGDGFEDLFLSRYNKSMLMLMSNQDGLYEAISIEPSNESFFVRFNDITRDGIPEVFFSKYESVGAYFAILTLDGDAVSVAQGTQFSDNDPIYVVASDASVELPGSGTIARIVLSNLLGQRVDAPFQQKGDMVTIDVSRLTSGMYWGVIEASDGVPPMYFKLLVE